MKKFALILSLALVTALSAGAVDMKGKTIALVPKTLNNPFFVAMTDATRTAAEAAGFEMRINAPDAETEVDKQISILETFIEQGVGVIITGPCSATAIVDTIKMADAKGIPVFLIDSGADESPYVSFVGTNNYEGGKIGARWIGENVKGEVAILDGFSGNDATTQRYKGFMEEIANYPDVKIVASEYANCELAKGMEVTKNFLTAYPNLRGIFAVNDNMAIGAGNAIAASGRRADIKICGFDGQPSAAQDIIDGNIDATIAQKPATMGRLTVEQIIKHLNGEQVQRIVDTGCDVVEVGNAQKYLNWQ
ncbi:MAG: sugar ABC transporter substrate-binding protein [Planctomycetaceae bacterium]|nr:sugar ABC transporter substrate-binding protein [Planctomycetaceae bacterium]